MIVGVVDDFKEASGRYSEEEDVEPCDPTDYYESGSHVITSGDEVIINGVKHLVVELNPGIFRFQRVLNDATPPVTAKSL